MKHPFVRDNDDGLHERMKATQLVVDALVDTLERLDATEEATINGLLNLLCCVAIHVENPELIQDLPRIVKQSLKQGLARRASMRAARARPH